MLSGISRVSERVYSTKPTAKFVPFHGKLLFKVFDFIIFSMALTLQSKKRRKSKNYRNYLLLIIVKTVLLIVRRNSVMSILNHKS